MVQKTLAELSIPSNLELVLTLKGILFANYMAGWLIINPTVAPEKNRDGKK